MTRGEEIEVGTKRGSDTHKTQDKIRYIEESHGGEGGEDEVYVEVKGDREGSDVSHPRGPRFPREKRERIGGENERKSVVGGEGVEVDMKTVSAQERIEGGEVSEKMGL